jgi:hypothetical protein
MILRRTVVGIALAAIALITPGATTAFGAEGPTRTGPSQPASDTSPPELRPETPRLKSAPLKGLPTLQQARERGLIPKSAEPSAAKGTGTSARVASGCSTPPQDWSYHDYLKPGECLTDYTYIAAHYGLSGGSQLWYELWLKNGDLILYSHHTGTVYEGLWHTGTKATWASAWMQSDGNFVIYNQYGDPIWNTGTSNCGTQGAWLRVQADANLVLYTRDWRPIWAVKNDPSSRPC